MKGQLTEPKCKKASNVLSQSEGELLENTNPNCFPMKKTKTNTVSPTTSSNSFSPLVKIVQTGNDFTCIFYLV